MITSDQFTTAYILELPPTTVVTTFAPCPVCAQTDFNHANHRYFHVAKCMRTAQAADELTVRATPSPMMGHYSLTVACRFEAHTMGLMQTFEGKGPESCQHQARVAGWSLWADNTAACPACTAKARAAGMIDGSNAR